MVNIYAELHKFNYVKFDDHHHKYTIDGETLTSATKIIEEYHEEFDEDFWSIYKSIQLLGYEFDYDKYKRTFTISDKTYDVESIYKLDKDIRKYQKQRIKDWKDKGERASILGSNLHNYIENHYARKTYIPTSDLLNDKQLLSRYKKLIKIFKRFYNKTKDILIPICSEVVVADKKSMVGGMIDQLFWNVKSCKIEVWDWKTNETIKLLNDFQKMYTIFKHLDDCNFNHYSIQLNIYKRILLKNTNLDIGNMYFTHFSSELNKYKIYKCLDLQKEVSLIL